MAAKHSKYPNGKWASALLMLLALLWLSVSTPFVYAAQQQLAAVSKNEAAGDEDNNPLAGTNEEKSESGVYAISEYLHEVALAANPTVCLVKYEKCHPSNLYFAYHPELHSPPPNILFKAYSPDCGVLCRSNTPFRHRRFSRFQTQPQIFMEQNVSPLSRLWSLVRLDKKDITTIYFFAILNGIIQLSLPLGIQAIIGFVLGGSMSASLVLLISLVVLGVLFNGLLQINQMKIIERIQQNIFVRYAYAFADRIPKLDLKSVDSYYLPELVNRFFETPTLQKSFAKLLLDLPTAMIQILFGLLLLCFYHQAFIFFGLILVFLLWLILKLTSSRGMETALEESKYKYAVAAWFEEMARVIKSFKFSRNSGIHLRKADKKAIGYLEARKQHFGVLLSQYRTLVGFKVLITAAMLIVGSFLLLDQQINIGQFIASEIIIITVITSVEKIIVNLDSVYDVMTSVEKISKLVEKPVEASGSLPLLSSQRIGIEGRNVTFGYDNNQPILRDVSFRIAPGEKVCVTGDNGSGKSTLLRLLSGAYSDFKGSILVNGVPIFNYDLASFRTQTGILLHHEDIFQATLRENLTMGSENVDSVYLHKLVERIGLTDFLASLERGYDTELDPAGKRLPRNVVQKVQLVRALLCKPQLLLLEEPWQGIEQPYRDAIQDILLHELDGTTVVVSSVDRTFASRCNQVIELQPK